MVSTKPAAAHWDRSNFRTNPGTGGRTSHINPEEQIKRVPVPDLRIVDQALWDRVKARQGERAIAQTDKKAWQARDERFLLTGLVRCGCCGGNYSGQGRGRMRCATSTGKGRSVCSNRTGIDAKEVGDLVLSALADCLMEESLVQLFADEYLAERKRLAATSPDLRSKLEKDRLQNQDKQNNLINAIKLGFPAEPLKASLEKLLEDLAHIDARLLALADAHREPTIHRDMATHWKVRIKEMIASVSQEGANGPTSEAIRALIDCVIVTPVDVGKKRSVPHIYLKGDLGEILRTTLGIDTLPARHKDQVYQDVGGCLVYMVAGAGSVQAPTLEIAA